MGEKKSSVKKRNWAFFVYPTKEQLAAIGSEYDGSDGYGSVPDDWRTRLQLSGLQFAISPLHDKDLTAVGEPKKAHHHVIVCFDSVKTPDQARELFALVGAVCPPDYKF